MCATLGSGLGRMPDAVCNRKGEAPRCAAAFTGAEKNWPVASIDRPKQHNLGSFRETSMPMHNQTAGNSYTRFMQAVNEELTKFECSEREFRKRSAKSGKSGYRCRSKDTTPRSNG
jgi:hypothetical protein